MSSHGNALARDFRPAGDGARLAPRLDRTHGGDVERWARSAESALATEPVDVAWYTTRERDYSEVLPWDHLDAGLDRDWLWQDWQDSIAPEGAADVEDCRWTPCYECGVCSAMGTEIQVGPTGERLDGRRLLPVVSGR